MDDKIKKAGDMPIEFSEAQKIDFCKEWPCAKRALELLRDIIKIEFIKKVIDIVIAAGDRLSGTICKPDQDQ